MLRGRTAARKVLAAGLAVAALGAVVVGMMAEISASDVREPIFATGVIVGAALIISAILVTSVVGQFD